jgi:uncharacterized protein
MIKRKYGERREWNRIVQREFAQSFLKTKEFTGYITLLHTIQVSEPLSMRYGDEHVCIVDDGYMWLQQFPLEKNHSVTTMYDANGDVIQWYIDICLCNGITDDSPWMDDLFLDIVLLPSGEIMEKDADELEEALLTGVIDRSLYELAWNEVEEIKRLLNKGNFDLVKLSNSHKAMLEGILKECKASG